MSKPDSPAAGIQRERVSRDERLARRRADVCSTQRGPVASRRVARGPVHARLRVRRKRGGVRGDGRALHGSPPDRGSLGRDTGRHGRVRQRRPQRALGAGLRARSLEPRRRDRDESSGARHRCADGRGHGSGGRVGRCLAVPRPRRRPGRDRAHPHAVGRARVDVGHPVPSRSAGRQRLLGRARRARGDGQALGVVSHYGTGGVAPTTDAGPTVERALEVVRSHGFNVRLATVS